MTIPTMSLTPHLPVDLSTKATVTRLAAMCDGRAICTQADLEGIICAVLAMRGLGDFKLLKQGMTKGQSVAVDQILRHLHGELILSKVGVKTYAVTDSQKLKPTRVRADLPNEFKFRVTSELVNYPSAVAIPCAEAVSLIGGNRVAKLVLPDVATTLQMLINKQSLPVKLGKLEKPDGGITGGIDFTKELRGVITKELARAGYLGALIEDGNNESLTFVVVDQYAQEFPIWLQTATRPWFRQWQLDLVRFYAEVENFQGTKGVILGEPTLQILRQQAGIKVAS